MKLADESMTVAELLTDLSKKGIKLRRSGSELILLGAEEALDQLPCKQSANPQRRFSSADRE